MLCRYRTIHPASSRKTPGFVVKPITPMLVSASILLTAIQAMAGPEGGVVRGGAGCISHTGNTTTIQQHTDRMAIDWSSYNVGAGERVQYVQPDSSSVSLNRIMSNSGSEIQGRIDANGQVILMNPHGILFTETAVVNTGGIMASGLSIDADDFMNGDFTFKAIEGTDGVVINSGVLNAATGGSVTLLGKKVKNDGLISANLGTATFAAGREAYVTFDQEGLVGVRITKELLEEDIGVDAAVINEGTIHAEDGQVLLTASVSQDIFTQAMNTGDMDYGGSVVVHDDGSFTLGAGADVINAGSIDVSGEHGGSVVAIGENVTHSGEILANASSGDSRARLELHSVDTTLVTGQSLLQANADQGQAGDVKLLGNNVGVIDEAAVSASGLNGGGRILVGGDLRGDNALVRNASAVYLGEEAQLAADALNSGTGGDVVLFSKDILAAYGSVSARGLLDAYGGFVETSSGKVTLDLSVDVSASNAQHGAWLIDPWNITIRDGSEYEVTKTSPTAITTIFSSKDHSNAGDTEPSYVDLTKLKIALLNGGNVTIQTTDGASTDQSQMGNITLADDLDYNSIGGSSTLTLKAHNNIYINAKISDKFPGDGDLLNLYLIANSDSASGDTAGSVYINNTIETNGGVFESTGVDFSLASGHSISTAGGGVTLSHTGDVSFKGDVSTNGGAFTVGSQFQRATSFTSAWDTNSNGIFDDAATINTSSATNNLGNISIYTSGDITLGVVDVGSTYTGNSTLDILLDSNANIAIQNLVDVGASAGGDYVTRFLLDAGNAITIGKYGRYDNGNQGFSNESYVRLRADMDGVGGGNILLSGDDANIYTGGGDIDVTGGDLTIGSSSGYGQLNAEGGSITIDVTGAVNVFDNSESWAGETTSPIRTENGEITIEAESFTAHETFSISTNGAASNASNLVKITTTAGNATLGTIDLQRADGSTGVANLEVTTSGDILQGNGSLLISGVTVLNSGSSNIQLESGSNVFDQGVHITQAKDVDLVSSKNLAFVAYSPDGNSANNLASSISGYLNATANDGAITQNDAFSVTGKASFFAGSNAITLDNAENNFGTLSFLGSAVNIHDSNDLIVGAGTASGGLTLVAGGAITDTDTANDALIVYGGDLSIQAEKDSQYYDIELTNDNRISSFQIVGAKNVTIKNTVGNLQIGNNAGDSNIKGNLIVESTNGSVTDYDFNTTNIDGFVSVTAPGSSVTLDHLTINYADDETLPSYISVNTQGNVNRQQGGRIELEGETIVVGSLNALRYGQSVAGNNSEDITITVGNRFAQAGAIKARNVKVYGDNGVNTFEILSRTPDTSDSTISYVINARDNDTDDSNNYNYDNRADGDDIFNIGMSTAAVLFGGQGVDTFNILAGGITVANIDGGRDLDSSKDIIVGPDVNSIWTSQGTNNPNDDPSIQGDDSGYITFVGDNSNQVTFKDIEQLRGGAAADEMNISHYFYSVSGGAGDDVITLSSGAHLNDKLYGGAGIDTITLSSADVVVSGGIYGDSPDGTDTAVSDEGTTVTEVDTLIGYNVADGTTVYWNISGNDINGEISTSSDYSNNKNVFHQFEVLKGNDTDGSNVDHFTVGSGNFTGEIYGGYDADTFIVSISNSNVSLYGDGGDDNFTFVTNSFTGTADGGAGIDTFDITRIGAATLSGGANDDIFNIGLAADDLTLIGNSGADAFNIQASSLSIKIYGGDRDSEGASIGDAFDDTLTGPDYANIWNFGVSENSSVSDEQQLVNGSAITRFSDIQKVQGGNQVDTFYFRQAYSGEVRGGDQDDSFYFYVSPEAFTSGATAKIFGESGDDQFVVENAASAVRINVDGGADGTDTLQFVSGANTWDMSAATVDSGGEVSEYTGIEVFKGGDGVDEFNINTAVTATIYGGDNNDVFNIDNVLTGQVHGEIGNDEFNIKAIVTDGDSATADILGGSGADIFKILTDVFTAVIDIDGGTDAPPVNENDPVVDNDTIVGFGVNTTWNITRPDEGTIDLSSNGNTDINFVDIENITGADGYKDSFKFSSIGGISGKIDGGDDGSAGATVSDEVDYSSATQGQNILLGDATKGIVDIENLVANSAYINSLSVDGYLSSLWDITGQYRGIVTATGDDGSFSIGFTHFHVLIGTAGADTFTFTDADTASLGAAQMRRIYGGGGDDWVNYAGLTRDTHVIIDRDIPFARDAELATDENRLFGVEGVAGSAGQNNTLTYLSLNNTTTTHNVTWTISSEGLSTPPVTDPAIVIDGNGDGTVTGNGTAVSFVDFVSLIGGDGDDIFQFGTGGKVKSVDGAQGNDTLIGRKEDGIVETAWSISSENGGGVEWGDEDWVEGYVDLVFSSIENLQGRDDIADTFSFIGSGSIVDTGSISAGDGDVIDIVDYSNLTIAQDITVGATGVTGAERIKANAQYDNILRGTSSYNIWKIKDIDAVGAGAANVGTIQNGVGDDADVVEFENFKILIGADNTDDVFTVVDATIQSIDGGTGSNTLNGPAVASEWTIDGVNSGSVKAGTTNYVGAFSNIQTLNGQADVADTFNITATGMFTGTIDGGSGAGDSLTVATPTAATHLNHRENFWEFSENSTRVSRVNTSGTSTGTTIFAGFESLTGGTGNDVFSFRDLTDFSSLTIRAGSGAGDTLSLASLSSLPASTSVDIEWIAGQVNYVSVETATDGVVTKKTKAAISGIDNVVGHSSRAISLVVADGDKTVWTIGTDADSSVRYASNDNGRLDFSNINSLIGNSADDIFTIHRNASFAGHLYGGGGDNTLVWTASDKVWSLSDTEVFGGDVGVTTFHNIQNLEGDNASSILIGRNQQNHWVISGENDGFVQLAEDNPDDETGNDRINFTNMYSLSGNVKRDRFEFATSGSIVGEVRGTVQGSADNDNDQLDFASANTATVAWTLASSVVDGHYSGNVSGNDFVDIEIFNGGAGQDTFSIQNANFSATINGGSGTLNGNPVKDMIRLVHAGDSTWTIDGVDNFIQVNGGGLVRLTGIETGEGSDSGEDTFNVSAQVFTALDGRGGDDTLTLDTSLTDNFALTFVGGADDDEIVAGDRNNTWRIGGTGNTLNYDASTGLGIKFDTTLENMTGGAGNDNFYILSLGLNYTVVGGDGTDTLIGANQDNSWVIGGSAANANSLNYVDSNNQGIQFSDIESYHGGSATDTFSLLSGSIAGDVAGGGSADTLIVNRSDVTSPTHWQINNANAGTVDGIANGFTSIENITGGNRIDAFVFGAAGSLSGLLQGAGHASDTLDLTAKGSGVVVTLTTEQPASGASGLHVNSVEQITAAADSDLTDSNDTEAGNQLINRLDNNFKWEITGRNTGRLTQSGMSPVTFSHFGDLQGSDGDDTFAFYNAGRVTGEINGGGADTVDKIDLSNYSGAVEVSLKSSEVVFSASDVSPYRGIEHIVGNNDGAGAVTSQTTLRAGDNDNTWDITGTNSGTVSDGVTNMVFSNISMLAGGAGQDTFNIRSGWISGEIDGGYNEALADQPIDTFSVSNISGFTVHVNGEVYGRPNVFNVTNMERLEANTSNNSLRAGSAGENIWDITADGEGTLNELAFKGFLSLIGNDNSDLFKLATGANLTSIDGEGGRDTITVNTNSQTNWHISGAGLGNVTGRIYTFSDIERLTGSDRRDVFTFDNLNASMAELIDGAGGDDELNVRAYTEGVVVVLGETLNGTTHVDHEYANGNPYVYAYRIENITAAEGVNNAGEERNWIAIGHDRPIEWVMRPYNDGTVQELEVVDGQKVPIDGTLVNFYNFGSLQGGAGDETAVSVDTNITGKYIKGSGKSNLVYGPSDGFVVIDLNPNLVSVTGNGNTLIRVVPVGADSENDGLNGTNLWLITGENAGVLNADYWGDGYKLTFTGVNRLEGGTGNDTFRFTSGLDDSGNITAGSLINGSINGGSGNGVDIINVDEGAAAILSFGYSHLAGVPLKQKSELSEEEISQNVPYIGVLYPNNSPHDVYLVEEVAGTSTLDVTEFVNIKELNVYHHDENDNVVIGSENSTVTLLSDDVGAFNWSIGANTANPMSQQVLENDQNNEQLLFSGVDAVRGGDADDVFNISQAGVVSRFINTGGGDDEINVSAIAGPLDIMLAEADYGGDVWTPDWVLDNVETLTTSSDSHRLIADNVVNNWAINGTNRGTLRYTDAGGEQLLSFENMLHLVGGSNNDIFTINNGGLLTGTIDGGGQTISGDDVLILAADATQALTVQISRHVDGSAYVEDSNTNSVDVAGLERISANGNGQPHTLLARTDVANEWSVAAVSTLSFDSKSILFSNFHNLTGGAKQDSFTLNGATVSGLIDGGANTADAVDSIVLNNINGQTVHLGARTTDDINLTNIESILATGTSMSLQGDDVVNNWTINSPGTTPAHKLVQTLADDSSATLHFGGFSTLIGGNKADSFVVMANDAITEVTAFYGGSLSDTLDLTNVTSPVTVSRDSGYANAYFIDGIETVNASGDQNRFVGGNLENNHWLITDKDTGSLSVSGQTTRFSGFSYLEGRDQVDVFEFEQTGNLVGSITGSVDGGGQPEGARDQVDMSDLDNADVVIGDENSGFIRIEEYIGKGRTSMITAANDRNIWTITGENTGTIVDNAGNNIRFVDFGILNGGDDVDTFKIEGGGVSGRINAGGSVDELFVDLKSGLNGVLVFDGGVDGGSIDIIGGANDVRFNTEYTANADASATLVYDRSANDTTYKYTVDYSNATAVNDDVYSSVLAINPVAGAADTITIADDSFEVDGFAQVDISHKNSIEINGELGDHLIVQGRISVADYFSVRNTSMEVQGADAGITANQKIIFDNISGVGSDNERLNISTASLELNALRGNVYLSQDGDIDIASMSANNNIVDLISNGEISGSGALTNSLNGELSLVAAGNITLDNSANNLSGILNLQSNTDVILTNGLTNLGNVQAQNLTLNTGETITTQGTLTIANTTVVNGQGSSTIDFTGDGHQFNNIVINNAGSLDLEDSSANGVTVEGSVNGDFNVGTTGVIIANAITAKHGVQLHGSRVDVNGRVNVTESLDDTAIDIDAGNGAVNIRGGLNANDLLAGDINIQGGSITQSTGASINGRSVSLNSQSDVNLQSNVTATQELRLSAVGAVNMADNVRAQASALDIQAGDDVYLDELIADTVNVNSASGNITQNADITGDTVALTANNGSFSDRSNTTLDFDTELTVTAQSAELNGQVGVGSGAAVITVDNSLMLDGSLDAQTIEATAGRQFVMNSSSNSRVRSNESMSITAGDGIQLTLLDGQSGSVTLDSGAAITDHNGSELNIIADTLLAKTETGFGAFDAENLIETSVANIDVRTNSGGVGVLNNRQMNVQALITNQGGVYLVNTKGNVKMIMPVDRAPYDRSLVGGDIRQAGGVIDANYGLGDITISIRDGALAAGDSYARYDRPEIIGNNVGVSTTAGFGIDGRQLVVYAKNLSISGRGIFPLWAFNEPANLTTDNDLLDPSVVGSASDLLVDIEPAEDIDPAIFTDVRNYSYANIAIRLPNDQLYDIDGYDDEEEEQNSDAY